MSVARVNGVSLYYEERGAGDHIVCIHGTSSSGAVWGDAVDELAKHGRTISYDRRGCFRSERPEPYVTDVHQHADDAAALIDVLDASPAVVIGRSYGGETAIDLALRYPDRVRALALLEPALLSMSEDATRWASALAKKVFATAEEDESAVAETFLRGVVGDEGWEAFPEPAKRMFTGNGPAILAENAAVSSTSTRICSGPSSNRRCSSPARILRRRLPRSRTSWRRRCPRPGSSGSRAATSSTRPIPPCSVSSTTWSRGRRLPAGEDTAHTQHPSTTVGLSEHRLVR
jgi:esterase